MKYRSYILLSQSVLCHRVFSGFSVSSSSLPFFFQALAYFRLLCVFYNLLTVLRGCFTPIGLIHLSQSLALSSPFLSFFSSLFFLLFSFFPPFFSLFLSLSPCRFLVRRPPPCRTASDGPEFAGLCAISNNRMVAHFGCKQRLLKLNHIRTP